MTETPNSPATASRDAARPKVPAFARYKGTSAWRKDRRRVRAYAWYLANEARKQGTAATPAA